MPRPKEKPHRNGPKTKTVLPSLPKEAGQRIKEKYKQQLVYRQPDEEAPGGYAGDKVVEATEGGVQLGGNIAGAGLRKIRGADTKQSKGPAPKSSSSPKASPEGRETPSDSINPDDVLTGRPAAGDRRTVQKQKTGREPQPRERGPKNAIAPEPWEQPDRWADRPTPWEYRPIQKRKTKRKLAEERVRKVGRTAPTDFQAMDKQDTAFPQNVPSGNHSKEKSSRIFGNSKSIPRKGVTGGKDEPLHPWRLPKVGSVRPGVKGVPVSQGKGIAARPTTALRQRIKLGAASKTTGTGIQSVTRAAKPAVTITKRLTRAAIRAVAAVVKGLIGLLGGGVLLPLLLVIVIAGALISSPFGILFSNQNHSPGTVAVSQAVGQVNREFSIMLDDLQSGDYDGIVLQGEPAEWPDVLAVFAVKTALYDGETAADVVTLDQDRVNRLKAVYWDMSPVHTWVETIEHPATEDESGWTEYILHISIEAKPPDEMAVQYGFTNAQKEALDELLEERELLAALVGNLAINDADAAQVLANLPADLNPARRAAVEKALELAGKVSYFWGGKSYGYGWDDRWGTLMEVTSPGSSTTGQYLPYGLDCTGFLDWAIRNAGLHSDGHWYLETNLIETTWEAAEPGDIALFPDDSHVGLVVGRDESGSVLVVHCSYSLNTVAISPAQAFGFTKVGRPDIYDD